MMKNYCCLVFAYRQKSICYCSEFRFLGCLLWVLIRLDKVHTERNYLLCPAPKNMSQKNDKEGGFPFQIPSQCPLEINNKCYKFQTPPITRHYLFFCSPPTSMKSAKSFLRKLFSGICCMKPECTFTTSKC